MQPLSRWWVTNNWAGNTYMARQKNAGETRKNTRTASSFNSAAGGSARTNQKNLIFSLAGEKYSIPLSSVKEVIGLAKITPIPHVPCFFKGLINLRGKIISVIDLRLKLEFPEIEYQAKKTSIIITDVNGLTIGTIVDDVDEVVGFTDEQLDENLDIATTVQREYILGVAKADDDRLVLMLDIEKLLTADELELMTRQGSEVAMEV